MWKEILTITLLVITGADCITVKREFIQYSNVRIKSWTENPFKFMVLLHGGSTCSGSIYNSHSVISAAYCFMTPGSLSTHVALEHIGPRVNPTHSIAIGKVFIPRNIQDTLNTVKGEDISVVRLAANINFSCYSLSTIELSNSVLEIGTKVIVVGYGFDASGSLKRGNAIVTGCAHDTDDLRICAKRRNRFSELQSSIGYSGAPILTKQDGRYITHGFFSGTITIDGQIRAMVFASYKKHETFIKNCTTQSYSNDVTISYF